MTAVYIHTYRSRLIFKGVAETSQIFLRDTHFLPKFLRYKKPIAVHLSAVNPLVAFSDIHERKGEVLFFCSVPGTKRDFKDQIKTS
jgi:hypothetical protein